MAGHRMFAKNIIDSDNFLDMPLSAQALYFHLAMQADDDGFVNNPKKIQRVISAADDDLKLLVAKQFIITFESGVIVIRHWKIHNQIKKDRYKPTLYTDEKAMLKIDGSNPYTVCIQDVSKLEPICIQGGSKLDTQDSIGKVSIDKDSIELGEVRVSGRIEKREGSKGEGEENPYRCYETIIGPLGDGATNDITTYQTVLDDTLICYVIRSQGGQGKSWAAIKNTLQGYVDEGVTTLSAVCVQ